MFKTRAKLRKATECWGNSQGLRRQASGPAWSVKNADAWHIDSPTGRYSPLGVVASAAMDAYRATVVKRDQRLFLPKPIPDETLRRSLGAARMTGSSKNAVPTGSSSSVTGRAWRRWAR